MVENPREIVPVNDPKNQSFGRTQAHYSLVSFYRAAPGMAANHARQKALVAASLPRQKGGVKPPLRPPLWGSKRRRAERRSASAECHSALRKGQRGWPHSN